MRVAVVHNQPTGGARRALHGFCRELGQRHEIGVITFDSADDEWLHDADIAAEVVRLPMRRRRSVRGGLYLNDVLRARDRADLHAAYAAAAAHVDADGWDVALVDACRYSLVPPVLTALRTPSVHYVHCGPARLEAGTWDPPQGAWGRWRDVWHGPFQRRLEERVAHDQIAAARSATTVVANSGHTALRVRAAYGVDAAVCPPGVDLPPPVPGSRGQRGRGWVLSVGEVEPRKGFGFVVEALGRIASASRPALRVIANRANPAELTRLRSLAVSRGVSLDVSVDPPAHELSAAYCSAPLFVYGAHHEALGLAPLEAMAAGTPVVAVAEGGVVETVVHGRTGVLTTRDSDAFADAVASLLADDGRRQAMGEAARSHVAGEWSWARRGAALEEVLSAVAGGRRQACRA